MLYLEIDKKHYGKFGLVQLKKGDDWILDAKIVSSRGDDSDIRGATAYASFPAASGGDYMAEVVPTLPECGKIQIRVPDTDSVNLAAIEEMALYVVLNASGSIETAQTVYQPVQIRERGYQSF